MDQRALVNVHKMDVFGGKLITEVIIDVNGHRTLFFGGDTGTKQLKTQPVNTDQLNVISRLNLYIARSFLTRTLKLQLTLFELVPKSCLHHSIVCLRERVHFTGQTCLVPRKNAVYVSLRH